MTFDKQEMKKILMAAFTVSLLIGATGCKPTEKNYQAAYEAAQRKRAADANDADMGLPAKGLQQIGAPVAKTVNGHEVLTETKFLKRPGGEFMNKYNVAVARYKMATNAKAQADRLTAEGYRAFQAEGTEGWHYVIAGTFDTLAAAADLATGYARKNEPAAFVGLPGAPVVIEKR